MSLILIPLTQCLTQTQTQTQTQCLTPWMPKELSIEESLES